MGQSYKHTNTVIFLLNYHFVWCPARRRKILTGALERDLRELLTAKSAELECEILAMETMPDHVHLFLNCPPTLSPSDAMFWLKGYSSRILREKYPSLRRMPSMWTRSFFVSTAGNVSSATIQKYIAKQKTR
jgi:putative transposase